jgi:hypothetical protein
MTLGLCFFHLSLSTYYTQPTRSSAGFCARKKIRKKNNSPHKRIVLCKGMQGKKEKELFSFSLRLFVALSLFDLMPIDDD